MCFGPCYHVDGGLTSLSTSKDGSQVVVAGRNGETMSKDHFVNYIGTISPPPPSPTPLPPTYPPCGHIIIMATLICPVTVRLLSVMGPSWPSWTLGLQENNNTFQESWLWANQQFVKKKNNQLLPAQNLDIDSKCFSRKRNVSPHNISYLKLITPRRHTCLTQAVILSFTSNFITTIAVLCKNRQP